MTQLGRNISFATYGIALQQKKRKVVVTVRDQNLQKLKDAGIYTVQDEILSDFLIKKRVNEMEYSRRSTHSEVDLLSLRSDPPNCNGRQSASASASAGGNWNDDSHNNDYYHDSYYPSPGASYPKSSSSSSSNHNQSLMLTEDITFPPAARPRHDDYKSPKPTTKKHVYDLRSSS